MSIWSTLGIAATNDEREIRRAYARKLKTVHPEDDPVGFQALREAHDQAMRMAKGGWAVLRGRSGLPSITDVAHDDPYTDDEDGDDDGWDEADSTWQASDRMGGPGPGWDTGSTGPDWTRAEPRPALEPEPGPALDPDIAAALQANREEAQAHEGLIRALHQQVSLEPDNAEAALETLLKVLRSPAMAAMTVHDRTERWLADLLVRPGDATAGLIDPVAHYFDWDQPRVGVDLRHAEAALNRREALAELRRIKRPESQAYRAFKALSEPVAWRSRLNARLSPGLAREVWSLLDRADYGLPQLTDSFNPATVQWWRDLFDQPRLGPMYLLFALFGPPIVTAMILAGQVFERPTPLDALTLWVVLSGSFLALGVGWLHAIAGPTRRWQQDNPWQKPLALRFGWLAAAVPLTLTGALVPPLVMPWSLAFLTALTFVWLAVAIWTRLTSSHVGKLPLTGNNMGFGFFCLILLVLPALLAPMLEGRTDPMSVTLLGLGLVAFLGRHALLDEWLHLDQPHRRQIAWVLTALSAGAITLTVLAIEPLTIALALAVSCLAALPGRLLPRPDFPPWHGLYVILGRGGWVVAAIFALSVMGRGEMGSRLAQGAFCVALVVPTLIVALAELPWPQRPRNSHKRIGQA